MNISLPSSLGYPLHSWRPRSFNPLKKLIPSIGPCPNRIILQLNGTFCQALVPYNFPLVVLHTISAMFFHVWCMLWGSVWIWMKSNLFWFIEGQAHYSTSWHAKSGWPSTEWYNCSSFKPPHYLGACTKNLPNMEGKVCKTTNSEPKAPLCWSLIMIR